MFVNKTYTVTDLFVYYIICLRLFIECKKTLSTKNLTVGLVLRKNLNDFLSAFYKLMTYMIIIELEK